MSEFKTDLAAFKQTPSEQVADVELREHERWRDENAEKTETRRVIEDALQKSARKQELRRDYEEAKPLRRELEKRTGRPASKTTGMLVMVDAAMADDPVRGRVMMEEFLARHPPGDAATFPDSRTALQRSEERRLKEYRPEGTTARAIADAVLAQKADRSDGPNFKAAQAVIAAQHPNASLTGLLRKSIETIDTGRENPQKVAYQAAMANGHPATPEQWQAYRARSISKAIETGYIKDLEAHMAPSGAFRDLAGRKTEIERLMASGKIPEMAAAGRAGRLPHLPTVLAQARSLLPARRRKGGRGR